MRPERWWERWMRDAVERWRDSRCGHHSLLVSGMNLDELGLAAQTSHALTFAVECRRCGALLHVYAESQEQRKGRE